MKTQQEIKDEITRLRQERDKMFDKYLTATDKTERAVAELANRKVNSAIWALMWVQGDQHDSISKLN